MKRIYVLRVSFVAIIFVSLSTLAVGTTTDLRSGQKKPLSYAVVETTFSKSYCEARYRILQKFELVQGQKEIQSFPISFPDNDWTKRDSQFVETCHDNDNLTVDTLYLPPRNSDSKKLVVLMSGIHGVEAPAGSALQLHFLENYILNETMKRNDLGILIIHSLNPYGFKFHRRFNFNNVDLNRNFLASNQQTDDQFKNDFNQEHEEYKGYFNEDGVLNFVQGKFWNLMTLGLRIAKGSKKSLKYVLGDFGTIRTGFASGQYRYPQGVYYGGYGGHGEPEQENQTLVKILEQYLPGQEEVVFLDIHTGVGEANILNVLGSRKAQDKKTKEHKFVKTLFTQPKGASIKYNLDLNDEQTGYTAHGATNDFIERILYRINGDSESVVAAGITLEYGTHTYDNFVSSLTEDAETMHYLVKENQGRHNGYKNEFTAKYVRDNLTHRFTPDNRTTLVIGGTRAAIWQPKVILQFDVVMENILNNWK